MPRRRSDASDASNVSLPTESYTAATPSPPVSPRTTSGSSAVRSANAVYWIACSAPAPRDSSAFSGVETVEITCAPRATSICVRSSPTPPAPACTSTRSPGRTGYDDVHR